MAKKGGMPIYKTVDDYFRNQSAEAQNILQQLRTMIHEAVSDVIEQKNAKVPTFIVVSESKSKHQLMISAYKNYVSFYPFQGTIDHFLSELEGFEVGKGTVKFKFDTIIPKDLIVKMVQYRKEELLNETQ